MAVNAFTPLAAPVASVALCAPVLMNSSALPVVPNSFIVSLRDTDVRALAGSGDALCELLGLDAGALSLSRCVPSPWAAVAGRLRRF